MQSRGKGNPLELYDKPDTVFGADVAVVVAVVVVVVVEVAVASSK